MGVTIKMGLNPFPAGPEIVGTQAATRDAGPDIVGTGTLFISVTVNDWKTIGWCCHLVNGEPKKLFHSQIVLRRSEISRNITQYVLTSQ